MEFNSNYIRPYDLYDAHNQACLLLYVLFRPSLLFTIPFQVVEALKIVHILPPIVLWSKVIH